MHAVAALIPPAQARPGKKATGVSLPEMLTASIVLFLIVGTVSSIYTSSLRSWQRASGETYAEQKASWAIQRMVPDLRLAMSVVPGVAPHEASYLTIQLPQRAFDASNNGYLNQIATDANGRPYLVPGGWVCYYRGDGSGNPDPHGDHIWRRQIAPDGTVTKQDAIADHVVDNPPDESGQPKPMFIYWPDVNRLKSVEITVTIRERQGSRVSQTTMNGEVALRNG